MYTTVVSLWTVSPYRLATSAWMPTTSTLTSTDVSCRAAKKSSDEKKSEYDGGFMSFLSRPKQEDKVPESKKVNADSDVLWGFFRREEDKKKTSNKPVNKPNRPPTNKPPPTLSKKESSKDSPAKAESSRGEPSMMSRIQSLFSKNTTSPDKDSIKRGSNSTNNPLAAVQKLLTPSDEEWIDVFPKTRIMPGAMVPVTVAGLDLLVIASRDGRRLYCIVNSCPHLGTPLETGQLVRMPIQASPTGQAPPNPLLTSNRWTETDVSNLLQQDGCEDCIVCPLHRTAFALESGQVRGEWCPYPPVLGKVMGTVKAPTAAAVFDVRTRGKNVQVRINSPLR